MQLTQTPPDQRRNRFAAVLQSCLERFLGGDRAVSRKVRHNYVSFLAAMDELCRTAEDAQLLCCRVSLNHPHLRARIDCYLERRARLPRGRSPTLPETFRLHSRVAFPRLTRSGGSQVRDCIPPGENQQSPHQTGPTVSTPSTTEEGTEAGI